jgi:adenylyltransferase/sulfurtransferase
MLEVSVKTLKSKLDAGDDFILLDVREPYEIEIANVPGALCIPMNNVPQRQQELDPDAEILVMCRSGKRSADVTAFLMHQGFTNVHNVTGGILAWATDVDTTVQKY